MSVKAKYELKLEVTETLEVSQDHYDDPEILHKIAADSGTLDESSTPACSKAWSGEVTLSAGSGSVDLTNLARGSVLSAVDLTGLKVQVVKISAPSGNSAAITVIRDAGGSGYNLFGADKSTAESLTLSPGDVWEGVFDETRADVGVTEKLVDLSGTGTDSISFELAAG